MCIAHEINIIQVITCHRQQVDILISKNQAVQILYLKHIKLHKLATMDRNPRKINPHKRYCTVLLLYYNSKQNIPYNWPTDSHSDYQQLLNFICVISLEYVTKGHIATYTILL